MTLHEMPDSLYEVSAEFSRWPQVDEYHLFNILQRNKISNVPARLLSTEEALSNLVNIFYTDANTRGNNRT